MRLPAIVAALAVTIGGVSPVGAAAGPRALWRVVHGICVPMRRLAHIPAPCLSVDLERQVAVVPNPRSTTEVLLVPTRRVSGIEDARLQAQGAPNYWADAWGARGFVARRSGRADIPDVDLAMAVNAIAGRSQDQLHIHIDCIRPEVKAALAKAAPRLASHWSSLTLRGGAWRARLLAGDTPTPDPFRLLADSAPGVASELGAWTLVVASLPRSAAAGPAFALLARRTEPGFNGHGEFLLDKRCAVLGPSWPPPAAPVPVG